MTAENIQEWKRRQPFIPFGLRLMDGTIREITYPDRIIATKDYALVAIPAKPESRRLLAESVDWVSLLHITELFPLDSHNAADSSKT